MAHCSWGVQYVNLETNCKYIADQIHYAEEDISECGLILSRIRMLLRANTCCTGQYIGDNNYLSH